MSLHRRCCCQPTSSCDPGWDACPDPVKVSVLSLNMQRRITFCSDVATGSGCGDLNGFEFTESLDSQLVDIEFDLVPATTGVHEYYQVRPAASNGGTVTFSLSCGTETLNLPSSSSFVFPTGCTYTCTDFSIGGTGTSTFTLSAPPDGTIINSLSGYIRVRQTGETDCLAELSLQLEVDVDEFYDYDYVYRTGSGVCGLTFGGLNRTLRLFGFFSVFATATYTYGECPSSATWTLTRASFSLYYPGGVSPGYISAEFPEPAWATPCPIGTPVDCVPPNDCLGPTSDAGEYLYFDQTGGDWGQDVGDFHTFTFDTPTIGVSS